MWATHALPRLFLTKFDPMIPDFSKGLDHASGKLLPAIAQDAVSGRVLMFAWMNQEAYAETLATGRAVYYSRSRGKLWRKGEQSGHQQKVLEMRVDCDADAILLLIEQTGAACHEGFESCFFRKVLADGEAAVVDERLVDPQSVYGQ
ncbi:phosphoribosyl-AMP cyclohydrolase [Rubripirellula amarantea]|uniref:Phosphoribosyl-AMP cyclohydrolase n=2 Tax=Rubripirellula amarantea TaxID=2527999 RepID=A0A5C5WVE6_9BACT|nr:phosphoribosyl-AMP cyclohydrolase [Rubripirellula amarantea]